ncbi:hypothetical protein KFK09_011867 [Dendrobium nobile]|uniref:GrpE protein homolog n=1 Tax=Dendrobium nobile TaxID=94219 RepID=A0A8T3BDU7_DENNO|nr:hypothetical protein KFK09_011867 [Dendrobium nobile]
MVSVVRNSSLIFGIGVSIAFLEAPRSFPSFLIKQRATAMPMRIKPYSYLVKPPRFTSFTPATAFEEAAKTEMAEETVVKEDSEVEPAFDNRSNAESISVSEEKFPSAVMACLHAYKEALENNNLAKISEIEAFLQSIEDERNSLASKVTELSGELLIEKGRILRISADFDNVRKRTEREMLLQMENVQGEVVERLLPVLDSFERAKAQIKPETDGEEKINSSYQSIYKQFLEILTSLGVEAIETLGNSFDPMLHEAIMREDSAEF